MEESDFFDRYIRYMKSKEWRDRRQDYLTKNPYCEVCKSEFFLNVHHLNYDSFESEQPEDLMTLCSQCHINTHAIFTYDSKEARNDKREEVKQQLNLFYKLENKILYSAEGCLACGYKPKRYRELRTFAPDWMNRQQSILAGKFDDVVVLCRGCSENAISVPSVFKKTKEQILSSLQTDTDNLFDGFCKHCHNVVEEGNIDRINGSLVVKVYCKHCGKINFYKYFDPLTCSSKTTDAYLKGYFEKYPEKSTLKAWRKEKNDRLQQGSRTTAKQRELV